MLSDYFEKLRALETKLDPSRSAEDTLHALGARLLLEERFTAQACTDPASGWSDTSADPDDHGLYLVVDCKESQSLYNAFIPADEDGEIQIDKI